MSETKWMSGQELIQWLAAECQSKKIPASDSAMILMLRELPDIYTWTRTLRHTEAPNDQRTR